MENAILQLNRLDDVIWCHSCEIGINEKQALLSLFSRMIVLFFRCRVKIFPGYVVLQRNKPEIVAISTRNCQQAIVCSSNFSILTFHHALHFQLARFRHIKSRRVDIFVCQVFFFLSFEAVKLQSKGARRLSFPRLFCFSQKEHVNAVKHKKDTLMRPKRF